MSQTNELSTGDGRMTQPMIAQQPSMVMAVPLRMGFGPHPMQLTCPYCQQNVYTAVRPTSGLLTFLSAGTLVAFGCVFGCCLIPFFLDQLKDVEHSCPQCHALIGKYHRLD